MREEGMGILWSGKSVAVRMYRWADEGGWEAGVLSHSAGLCWLGVHMPHQLE